MLDTSPYLHIDSTSFDSPPISSNVEKRGIGLELESRVCQNLREVLQLKLQQRHTREDLIRQGIMPPLKSPAAFHEQRRSLERAKTEDYLKRKIRNRPARSELVRMHILEVSSEVLYKAMSVDPVAQQLLSTETCAEASLQVKQIMLKRARLADDLNDKLSQRPGPMELIQKNIIPVPSSIRQVLIDAENSLCGEDSSDALSPDQPVSQDPLNQDSSLSSAPLSASPDPSVSDSSPAQAPPPPPPPPLPMTTGTDSQQKMTNGKPAAQQPMTGPSKGSKAAAERSRKQKDSKPKVKKLKYHQYIPPDQKVERETLPPLPALDSAYSKLLNQQQLYLQLQIISQQHHLNYPTILPAPPRPPGDQQASSTSGCSSTKKAPPTQPPSTNLSSRYDIIKFNIPPLPPNLEELKVAELKHQLKIRALPVSGTKNDLIERLRTFHEQNECTTPSSTTEGTSEPAASTTNTPQTSQPPPHLPQTVQSQTSTTILHQPGNSRVVVAALPFVAAVGMCRPPPPSADHSQIVQFGSCSPSSPLSPSHSEHSLAGRSPDGHACNGDTVGETVSSPLTQLSLQHSPPTPPTVHIIDSPPPPPPVARGPSLLPRPTAPPGDKDQMLQEKDQRIAELTRMLQQKQRQVERLRSQLHDQQTVACISLPPITVKEEPLDISMEEVEEIVQVEPQQQNCLEEFILQQNQLNLQKPAQNRRKKKQTKQQPQPRQTNTQHSGTPLSSQLLVDCPKSNSTPSLVRNGNSNRFLLTQTNHSTNGRADMGTQNKVANRVHQQRLKSTPSKLPSQSAPSIEVQPKQQTICKQPLKKALKPEKHGSANHIKARSVSFCMPSNVQPFCSTVPSPNSPVHCSVNQREEMCLGVGQHVLFTPPSPKPIPSTPTSRRKKSGRTQKIDDLFDLLVQSGEISSNFRPTPDPALSRLCASSPSPSSSPLHHCTSPLTPSAPDTPPRPPAELTPPNRWQSPNRGVNGRLEDFLESTTGKPLLGVESGSHVTVIDELHSQLLSTPSILDHPASPMDTYELGLSSSHTGLELAESALSSMEWLDLGIGGSTGDGTGHTQSCVFSTDFLDSPDLQLHWDCL